MFAERPRCSRQPTGAIMRLRKGGADGIVYIVVRELSTSARRAFPVRNALPQQRGAATTDVGIKVLYAHEA